LTLTAPSFGRVHRGKISNQYGSMKHCPCGDGRKEWHKGIEGTPFDLQTYDVDGQVNWNARSGKLWDNTKRQIERIIGPFNAVVAKEWQKRHALHYHIVLRFDKETTINVAALKAVIQSRSVFDRTSNNRYQWGEQNKIVLWSGEMQTIRVLTETLYYVVKYTVKSTIETSLTIGSNKMREFTQALNQTAKNMRCANNCPGRTCPKKVHRFIGSTNTFFSATRQTKNRSGWSMNQKSRAKCKKERAAWAAGFETVEAYQAHIEQQKQEANTQNIKGPEPKTRCTRNWLCFCKYHHQQREKALTVMKKPGIGLTEVPAT